MSLYYCIDQIDIRLSNLLNQEEQTFLESLKQLLQNRVENNHYLDLEFELKMINDYEKKSKLNETINYIRNDLNVICYNVNILKEYKGSSLDEKQENYLEQNIPEKFLSSFQANRIAKISYDFSYRRGNSRGECYGFVFAMADKRFSPYENQTSMLHLNPQIFKYQKYQIIRKKDQDTIKMSRLTRTIFEPHVSNQAQQLLAYAKKQVDQDLSIRLKEKNNSHRVYLRVQKDGKIRYMDPVFDAYLFEKEEDFINFYVLSNSIKQPNFHFYQICKLTYDPKNQLKESFTWQGKIRTLLTGHKYLEDKKPPSIQRFFYTFLGLINGGALGFILGAIIGSIFPGYGTILGGILGGTLFCLISSFTIYLLQEKALKTNLHGFLSIPHYLKNSWYNFKNPPGVKPENHKTEENSWDNSSTYILSSLKRMNSPQTSSSELPCSIKLFAPSPTIFSSRISTAKTAEPILTFN